jgi:hypothetical protein
MQVNNSSASQSLNQVTGSATSAVAKQEQSTGTTATTETSTEDTVTISNEAMAMAMGDNPGNWPDPPTAPTAKT